MDVQLYNITQQKTVPIIQTAQQLSTFVSPKMLGCRWIVLAVMCKRMQQLQARMELRVHHGMDTPIRL